MAPKCPGGPRPAVCASGAVIRHLLGALAEDVGLALGQYPARKGSVSASFFSGGHLAAAPAWAPRANAIAERWIASAHRECLDRMLITGERHLQLVLGEYADHYNTHRPHRTLHQNPPAGRQGPPAAGASIRVLRRDRLGGLIHEYSQVA